MAERFDLVVVGAGPAGLTAAIYAARARLRTIVLDEGLPGGQVKTTHKVSNYPGFPEDVKGTELAALFAQQAERFGARIARAIEITDLDLKSPEKRFVLDEEEEIVAPAVIVATGAKPRALGIPGETDFRGRGLSYCATCDGAYFEGKDIHVIGGGNSAVEESLFLTQFAKSITIIHQFDHFQAEAATAKEALENPKIRVLWSHEPRAFLGDASVERLRVEDLQTHEMKELATDGVFVFVGMVPRTELLKGVLPLDKWGCVETDDSMATAIPGLYAAGDIRAKKFRQITTAVADGTIAALAAQKFLRDSRTAAAPALPIKPAAANAQP
jgi:thioredoxin reductase (NADPH)